MNFFWKAAGQKISPLMYCHILRTDNKWNRISVFLKRKFPTFPVLSRNQFFLLLLWVDWSNEKKRTLKLQISFGENNFLLP